MKTILVLFGGRSTEYGVSLQSAHAVLSNLDRSRYRPLMVGITREGRWLHYSGPLDRLEDDTWHQEHCVSCALSPDFGTPQLLLLDGSNRQLAFDAAFPVLHGKNGEDGTVQGLLELTGAPLIGCGCLASALCMDKDRAHKLAQLAGVSVPRSALFRQGAPLSAIGEAAAGLGYPLFVKPVRAGSSFGVTRVTALEQLAGAVADAFANDRELLLEEAIDGREVEVAVLGGERDFVSACGEIAPNSDFYDYDTKYVSDTAEYYIPARIAPKTAETVRTAAGKIFRTLGCTGLSRVDFFVTADEAVYFNEINTIPGFTAISMYPRLMRQSGVDGPALIDRLVEDALGR